MPEFVKLWADFSNSHFDFLNLRSNTIEKQGIMNFSCYNG